MGNIWKFVNIGGTDNRSGPNLNTVNILTDSIPTLVGIDPVSNNLPESFSLAQNYPNPFNPSTKIRFEIPKGTAGNVQLIVYDVMGREIEVLLDERLTGGEYEVNFLAGNITSGVYFYKLITGSFTDTKKMILIK
jgi:hypothetical protein